MVRVPLVGERDPDVDVREKRCRRWRHCRGSLCRGAWTGQSVMTPGCPPSDVRSSRLLDATQDERPRRTALTRRPSLQLAVHSVRDIDSRAHEAIVPYLWRGVTERGRLGNWRGHPSVLRNNECCPSPIGDRRSVAPPSVYSPLVAPFATSWTTTHRCAVSRSHWAPG